MTENGRETFPQRRLQRILPHVLTPPEDRHTTTPQNLQMLLVRQELQRVRRDPIGEMIYHREWAHYFSQLRQKLLVDTQKGSRPPLSQPPQNQPTTRKVYNIKKLLKVIKLLKARRSAVSQEQRLARHHESTPDSKGANPPPTSPAQPVAMEVDDPTAMGVEPEEPESSASQRPPSQSTVIELI